MSALDLERHGATADEVYQEAYGVKPSARPNVTLDASDLDAIDDAFSDLEGYLATALPVRIRDGWGGRKTEITRTEIINHLRYLAALVTGEPETDPEADIDRAYDEWKDRFNV